MNVSGQAAGPQQTALVEPAPLHRRPRALSCAAAQLGSRSEDPAHWGQGRGGRRLQGKSGAREAAWPPAWKQLVGIQLHPPTPAGDLGLPQDTAHLSVLVCETAVGWPVGVATGPSPASSTPQPGSWLGARLSETGRLTHGAPRGVGAWKTLEMWQFLLLTFLFKNMLHFSKRVFHQKCDFLGFAPTAWGGRCSVFCCFHTRATRVPVKSLSRFRGRGTPAPQVWVPDLDGRPGQSRTRAVRSLWHDMLPDPGLCLSFLFSLFWSK